LAALFIVRLFRQSGAPFSLTSEAFDGHSGTSDPSVGALQHFLSRIATKNSFR
jgi:hypothetical protein